MLVNNGLAQSKQKYHIHITEKLLPQVQKIEYIGTVLEKNATVTLNGNTYDDVIKVRVITKVTIDTQITTTTSEFWFANEVGPIREYTNDSGTIAEQTLISYTLY